MSAARELAERREEVRMMTAISRLLRERNEARAVARRLAAVIEEYQLERGHLGGLQEVPVMAAFRAFAWATEPEGPEGADE